MLQPEICSIQLWTIPLSPVFFSLLRRDADLTNIHQGQQVHWPHRSVL